MAETTAPALAVARPFPGLRSFTYDEAHLFFGREGQSNRVVELLGKNRFVAVVGTSGCGKSSLVRAGLLPALDAGAMDPRATKWQVADLRPQDNPFGNLAEALAPILQPEYQDDEWLRAGCSSLIEAVGIAKTKGTLEQDENLLILVDQFEELFRYRIPGNSDAGDRDEKAEFVALLLKAAEDAESRVYVAITLRSDFLGDCAQFRDLPEAINRSQYLVPRMTREERRSAIEGPMRVAGAAITPRLVRTLLNDLGEDPDQLPVLQHALMRMWDVWLARGNRDQAIDIRDYEDVGSLRDALGRHADEVLAHAARALGEAGPTLAMRIFQRLRVVDSHGRETRSPATVRELAEAANATPDDVRTVLDDFRDDASGCTFLTPFKSVQPDLADGTQIDLTHEALLRCWPRLATEWAADEELSRRIYTRLATLAETDGGRPDPIRGGMLDRIAEWWDRRQPSKTWGVRYHAGYDAAKQHLEWSRETDREEKSRKAAAEAEALRQAEQRRDEDARRQLVEEQLKAEAARNELVEEKLRRERAKKQAAMVVLAMVGFVLLSGWQLVTKLRAANEEKVTYLLASSAAAAASERGPATVPSLLLAALSLRRAAAQGDSVTIQQAKRLVTANLALLTPTAPWPTETATRADFGELGRRLALLGTDGTLRVFAEDAFGGRREVVSIASAGAFAFASTEPILAVARADSTIRIWNLESGDSLTSLRCSRGAASDLRVSSDATVLVALCGSRPVVWKQNDAGRLTPRDVKLTERQQLLKWSQLALSADGIVLALARQDADRLSSTDAYGERGAPTLLVMDVDDPTKPKTLDRMIAPVSRFEFVADDYDHYVLATSNSATTEVIAWDLAGQPDTSRTLEDRKPRFTHKHSAPVTTISRSYDGHLVVGGRDGVISMIDAESGKELAVMIAPDSVRSVAIGRQDHVAVAVTGTGQVHAWKLAGRTNMIVSDEILSAQSNSTGSILLYRGRSTADIIGLDSGVKRGSWKLASAYPISLARGDTLAAFRAPDVPTQTWLLSVQTMGANKRTLWSTRVSRALNLGNPIFSPDGQYLIAHARGPLPFPFGQRATGLADTAVKMGVNVWDARTGRPLGRPQGSTYRSFSAPLFCVAASNVLLTGRRGATQLDEVTIPGGLLAPRKSTIVLRGKLTGLGCSSDGTRIAIAEAIRGESSGVDAADSVSLVRVLSVASGAELASFTQPGEVRRVDFTGDGQYVSAISVSDTVSVWDLRTKRLLLSEGQVADPIAAIFTPGQKLMVVTRQGIRNVLWTPADLVREACNRVGRDLTEAEWKRYMRNETQLPVCPDAQGPGHA